MHKFVLVLASLLVSQAAFAKPIPTAADLADFEKISAEQRAAQKTDVAFDFSGIAKLPGCSGSVVSFGQDESAKAIVATNGHCVGLMDDPNPNVVAVDKPYNARISLYTDMQHTIPAQAVRLVYGIMMPNDVAYLRLDKTYKELAAKGVKARRLSEKMAAPGTAIALASGYFGTVVTCTVEKIIPIIREDIWTNVDSYKYHCKADHGTSGSPLIDLATNEVVGVNYTGNDSGEQCTYNNPCEVDAQGNITVEEGAGYGDQTYKIMGCLGADRELDLAAPGCTLPKP